MSGPAVFLDRDDTVIEDPGFIDHPDQVRLKPGAAGAIRRLRKAGYAVVVASNQSGIARGLITEEQLAAVHRRLRDLLQQEGADLDAIYSCPYLAGPDAVVEAYRKDSDLRKPKPGMLFKAARELGLDLPRSWMIGDRPTDIEAGRRAGCRTILIAGSAQGGDNEVAGFEFRALSLAEAANIVAEQTTPPADSGRDESGGSDPQAVNLLTEIRDLLDRQHRAERQEDFSFLRLFGTLAQMLAIVMAVWGLSAMFEMETVSFAVARFALAGFFQLVTLTIFVVERRR